MKRCAAGRDRNRCAVRGSCEVMVAAWLDVHHGPGLSGSGGPRTGVPLSWVAWAVKLVDDGAGPLGAGPAGFVQGELALVGEHYAGAGAGEQRHDREAAANLVLVADSRRAEPRRRGRSDARS